LDRDAPPRRERTAQLAKDTIERVNELSRRRVQGTVTYPCLKQREAHGRIGDRRCAPSCREAERHRGELLDWNAIMHTLAERACRFVEVDRPDEVFISNFGRDQFRTRRPPKTS
jgi:hypothetical protein